MRRNRSRVRSSCEIASSDSRSWGHIRSTTIQRMAARTRYAEASLASTSSDESLERLLELPEPILVLERNLDAAGVDVRLEAGQTSDQVTHARGERGIDRHARPALLRPRTGPASRTLRVTDRQPAAHDLPGQPAAAVVVRDCEDGTRVALRQLAALEHREDVLRQLEEAHTVRDRRLRPADALGEVAERQRELVDQDRVRPRFLDR